MTYWSDAVGRLDHALDEATVRSLAEEVRTANLIALLNYQTYYRVMTIEDGRPEAVLEIQALLSNIRRRLELDP